MTTKKAWETIMIAFSYPPSKRNKFEKDLTYMDGICYAIARLRDDNMISVDDHLDMDNMVWDDVTLYGSCAMFADSSRSSQLLRADYCTLMAEMEG